MGNMTDVHTSSNPEPRKPWRDQLLQDFKHKWTAVIAAEENVKAALQEAKLSRVEAAKALAKIRKRVEADKMNWWGWFDTHMRDIPGLSRPNAEALLALARADDPIATHQSNKDKNKARMAEKRAKTVPPIAQVPVQWTPPVEGAGETVGRAFDLGDHGQLFIDDLGIAITLETGEYELVPKDGGEIPDQHKVVLKEIAATYELRPACERVNGGVRVK